MKLKDLKKLALCASIIPVFISCQSTKTNRPVVKADAYSEDGIELEAEPQEDELPVVQSTEAEPMTAEDSIKSAKKTNAFQDFFSIGNKNDIMVCDSTTVFTTGLSGKPAQKEALIILNTKDGTAGFGSPYLAAYYIIQLDETARKKLATAVENYISDFDNKRLERKGKNLNKKYGTIDMKLHWGAIKSSTPNNGRGKLNIGYTFENKSPYFTLSAYPVKNDYYDVVGESTTRESMNIKYYFTKAQARTLVEMLSDEKLADYLGITKPFVPVESDVYED